jgi:hypothetical protein
MNNLPISPSPRPSISPSHPTRRAFLRSSSALIALPFLESFGAKQFQYAAASATATPPKRMMFLSFGWGPTKESWFPDVNTTGSNYTLPAGIKGLMRHQKDITVIQKLTNQFSDEAHWGSTFYLTGANRYSEPGQSFSNTVSADQVAAEVLGKETRFTSLQLGCDKAENSGHGPGLSLAWNRQGKPMAGLNNPLAAYHKLFADDKTPLAQRQAMLQQRRSVLDTVLENAKTMNRGLSSNDTDKLDEYFQSVREIEVRLSKEEQWLDVPKRQPSDLEEPEGKIVGYEEVKLMYDIMVAAMQIDATRVMTYRQPVDTFIRSLGATISGHNMSHYTNGARRSVAEMRDEKQTELLAYLIDKLKATKEPDGSSLFDNTSLSYGSNIESIHYLKNCPTIITGGGAGVKHGRHLVMEGSKTPLSNLWLSLLQGSGINAESHGDSTGTIKELFV